MAGLEYKFYLVGIYVKYMYGLFLFAKLRTVNNSDMCLQRFTRYIDNTEFISPTT